MGVSWDRGVERQEMGTHLYLPIYTVINNVNTPHDPFRFTGLVHKPIFIVCFDKFYTNLHRGLRKLNFAVTIHAFISGAPS